MRVLLVEAQSGISGDMFVAAAARLAGSEKEVEALPARLGLEGVTCGFRDVTRGSLRCRKFDVGHGSPHPARHGHPHDHAHRPLSAIRERIAAAGLDAPVRERALRMFERLGEVEASAHGIPVEQVHFHEVGAVDSIVDIVAAALVIERLGIEAAFSTPVCVGSGTIRTAHGTLPVPAPATERLLHGMPTIPGDMAGEWTTPTGALILAELGARFDIPALATTASALGAGDRDPPGRANALRLRLATTGAAAPIPSHPPGADGLVRDEVIEIRCNLDDATGEMLGAELLDLLLEKGARDAVLVPVTMKRGRPGHQLEVLVDPDRAEDLAKLLLTHTSTIGVRMRRVERLLLPRETCVLETKYGKVDAKVVHLPDGTRRTKPEYASCHARAKEHGVPVQEVYRAALAASEGAGA
jgi:uncharacterized protein (TIGR00299 family) protein